MRKISREMPRLILLSLILICGWLVSAQDAAVTCPGFLPSRLVVGEWAAVTSADTNTLRFEASLKSPKMGKIPSGGVAEVWEGPVCGDHGAWWRVVYDGMMGWALEGQDDVYWLEPLAALESEQTDLAGKSAAVPGYIVFRAVRDGQLANLGLFLIKPDGTDLHAVSDEVKSSNSYMPSWSPDRTQIAFSGGEGVTSHIYITNSNGTNTYRLTPLETPSERSPQWSPDGTQIAFTVTYEGNSDVYIIDADGTDLLQITDDPGRETVTGWSPDGTQLVLTGEFAESGNKDIYLIDVDGTNLRRITTHPDPERDADWSPDGTQFVFVATHGENTDVYTMNIDGTNTHRLTHEEGDDQDPDWSPDGTQIAFISEREDLFEIYIMDANGQNVYRVTDYPGGDYPYNPDW